MVNEILQSIEQKMNTSVEVLRKDLASIRTGHATPALIEHIKVEYGGVPLPLNQVATISAPEARLLVVHPWDKTAVRNIEKAIQKSDLGLTPVSDGANIRLSIPQLTEERREELIKTVHRRTEDRKVAVRNLRREAVDQLKQLEKDKEISQDDNKRALEHLQKLTDNYIAAAEQVRQEKEAELREV